MSIRRSSDRRTRDERVRARAALGIAPDARVGLSLGSLVSRKDPLSVIQAVRRLPIPTSSCCSWEEGRSSRSAGAQRVTTTVYASPDTWPTCCAICRPPTFSSRLRGRRVCRIPGSRHWRAGCLSCCRRSSRIGNCSRSRRRRASRFRLATSRHWPMRCACYELEHGGRRSCARTGGGSRRCGAGIPALSGAVPAVARRGTSSVSASVAMQSVPDVSRERVLAASDVAQGPPEFRDRTLRALPVRLRLESAGRDLRGDADRTGRRAAERPASADQENLRSRTVRRLTAVVASSRSVRVGADLHRPSRPMRRYRYIGFEPSTARAGFCRAHGFDVREASLPRTGLDRRCRRRGRHRQRARARDRSRRAATAAVAALRPGGLLIVIVPNVHDVRQLQPRWRNRHHWQPHCHINYFSADDLARLFERHGLRLRFFGLRGRRRTA